MTKEKEVDASPQEETERESGDDNHGAVVVRETRDEEEGREGVLVKGAIEESGEEEKEGKEEEPRCRRRRIALLVATVIIVIVVIVVVVVTAVDSGNGGDISSSVGQKALRSDSPCARGEYEGRTVIVTPENGETEFCGKTLRTGTAYVMDGDVACSDDHGPRLSSRTCLDCSGHTIVGVSAGDPETPTYEGIRLLGAAGAAAYNCVVRNFHTGISMISSTDVAVTNIEAVDNHHGVYEYEGRGNNVSCSVASNNEMNGLFSRSSHRTHVKGLISRGNSVAGDGLPNGDAPGSGVRFVNTRRATLRCSDVSSNGGYGIALTNSDYAEIRSTVASNNTSHNVVLQEHRATLAGVQSCYADRGSDIHVRREGYVRWDDPASFNDLGGGGGGDDQYADGTTIAASDLTCDEVTTADENITAPPCDNECPASLSSSGASLTIPTSCDDVCPHGIGRLAVPDDM